MKNKIQKGDAALAFLIVAISFIGTTIRATARAGPLIPTHIPTPLISPSVSPTQEPSATPTSTRIPTETKTPHPTATATLQPSVYISAMRKIKHSLRYYGIVKFWLELEPEEYRHDIDPALVIAIIVAESGGDPHAVSYANAIGLMQVIPKPWTPGVSCLKEPRCNIYWGLWIFDNALRISEGDIRYALAYFNCSERAVHNDECGPKGGLHYADNILELYYPLVIGQIQFCEKEIGPDWYTPNGYNKDCRDL